MSFEELIHIPRFNVDLCWKQSVFVLNQNHANIFIYIFRTCLLNYQFLRLCKNTVHEFRSFCVISKNDCDQTYCKWLYLMLQKDLFFSKQKRIVFGTVQHHNIIILNCAEKKAFCLKTKTDPFAKLNIKSCIGSRSQISQVGVLSGDWWSYQINDVVEMVGSRPSQITTISEHVLGLCVCIDVLCSNL